MMNDELLVRFLTKTCTNEELLEIEKLISHDRTVADRLFEMERVWSLKDEFYYSDKKKIETAYNLFLIRTNWKTTQEKTNKKQIYPSWMKYAAACIIICLLATNIFQLVKNIVLDNEVICNTIEVPIGQRVSVSLADGTKVWLNSGSILSYPVKFNQKNRIIRLDGEGYFEVIADRENPFTINTSRLEVKVTGTKFNVKAYPDEDICISLIEGELLILAGSQSAIMSENELVIWSETSGLVHYKNREIQHFSHWISGEMMFVDERLADIAKVIERRFGVTVVFDAPELADERFTCRTQQGTTLDQVLNLLKTTKKINYSIREFTVYISE